MTQSPLHVRHAGFGVRLVASLLDTLVLALPVGVVIYFLSDGAWLDFAQYQQNIAYALAGNASAALAHQPTTSFRWELLFEISVLIVTILFWKKWRGATPGKKIVKIKIVDAITCKDITNRQAITRSLGYIISIIPFLLGFLIVAFRKDKRAFHDLLADTVVIYDEDEGNI